MKEPGRDNFSGRIFEAFHIIQKTVVDPFDEWHNLGIDFGEVLNKAPRVECPIHNDIDTVVVPVQIFALMAFR
jgi:hypothetical protein